MFSSNETANFRQREQDSDRSHVPFGAWAIRTCLLSWCLAVPVRRMSFGYVRASFFLYMKKLISIMLCFCVSMIAMAQDVIVKKDGSTIISKVLEVSDTEVKYKKFSNLEGPTYTIKVKELQAINFQNGEKESFQAKTTLDEHKSTSSYMPNNEIPMETRIDKSIRDSNMLQRQKLLASAKGWRTAGGVIIGLGAAGTLACILFTDVNMWIPIAGGVAIELVGSAFRVIGNQKEAAANAINISHIYKHDFNIGNGNLSAGIDMMNDHVRSERALGIGVSYSF